jgi:mannosyltransferase OCH1-like enzyme
MGFAQVSPDRPPIIQYWHSESVPADVAGLFATFRDQNPDLSHLVFSETSAANLIREHFGPRELRAFRSCAVPAMQADYFRNCAILILGGLYCDADTRCVARVRSLIPPPGHGQLFVREWGSIAYDRFAFGAPDHPLLKLTLEIITANIEHRLDRVFFATGPPVLNTLYWLYTLGSFEALSRAFEDNPSATYLHSYCEIIGDYTRVIDAFEGVEISPVSKVDALIGRPMGPLGYKKTDMHWTKFKGEIFKTSVR